MARKKSSKARPPGFPVVGIGASAGGLEALGEFLGHLPADTGLAFVVVTHQHPEHTSMLAELLGKITDMPVFEASDGIRVEANRVYVGQPGGQLAIHEGVLFRKEVDTPEAPRLPIDHFFRSLARDQRERAICIILSGNGTDGTLGLRAIKAEAGMAMVEELQSARYAGMPSSAITTGLVDYVLPPEAMPDQLIAYVRGPHLQGRPVEERGLIVSPGVLQQILALLHGQRGHDFSEYKSNMVYRRIERRMSMHQIADPDHYVRYLQENPHEIDTLFKELLISVTSFFRDLEAWEALIPPVEDLLRSRTEKGPLRAWVPGCATGEEAFSLAILLRECMERAHRHFEAQIFGTDLDAAAIATARAGEYPDGVAADVPPPWLKKYLVHDGTSYRIRPEIREMVIFAPQNVIKDPPFTRMDVISCRNLLIYLGADAQSRLLPVFQHALRPLGLLLLGPSETVGFDSRLFETVDKRWKLFRRKPGPSGWHALLGPPPRHRPTEGEGSRSESPPPAPNLKSSSEGRAIQRMLLRRFVPTAIVVNDRNDIVFIHGRTGDYLEPSPGEPRHNIVEMARDGLRMELAAALRQSASSEGPIVRENVRIKTNGGHSRIRLRVERLQEQESPGDLLLVTLTPMPAEEQAPPEAGPPARGGDAEQGRVEQMERELQNLSETYQTTVEELETANEELQSANEELQSTNEELETSKEEMQSLNEELTTVNTELHAKVEALSRANDDMQNLLNSTDIATVFLDNELNIKRFTAQAKDLVMLRQSDLGRPISDLVTNLDHEALREDCRRVIRSLVLHEGEVRSKKGAWYLMRIIPYRTAENVIDGLVMTFVDISRLKEAQEGLRRMSKVFQVAEDPILLLGTTGLVLEVNDAAIQAHGCSREELVGRMVEDVMPGSGVKQMLGRCLAGERIRSVSCDHSGEGTGKHPALLTLTLLSDANGEPQGLALTVRKSLT